MKRSILSLTALLLLLFTPALAQSGSAGNVNEAKRLADSLSQQNDLPVNVRLRFQLLRDMMGGITGKGDPSNTLNFFSTTRILFWNRPANPSVGQTMRDFEAQVTTLARAKGINLDLPPVGYSTAGAAGGAAPPPAASGTAGPLLTARISRESLAEFTLRAEESGTETLAQKSSPQLLALRDSLTVLRQDLADPQVASDAVRNVLQARAVFLASPAAANAPAELRQRLDRMAEALRTVFPPDVLRQMRGQQITI